MGASKNRGHQNRPQYTMLLTIRTLKSDPQFIGTSHIVLPGLHENFVANSQPEPGPSAVVRTQNTDKERERDAQTRKTTDLKKQGSCSRTPEKPAFVPDIMLKHLEHRTRIPDLRGLPETQLPTEFAGFYPFMKGSNPQKAVSTWGRKSYFYC